MATVTIVIITGAAILKAKCAFVMGWHGWFQYSNPKVADDKSPGFVHNEVDRHCTDEPRCLQLDKNTWQEKKAGKFTAAATRSPSVASSSSNRSTRRPILRPSSGAATLEHDEVTHDFIHRGLHSTGSSAVVAVDSSNIRVFFAGPETFKVVLVTESAAPTDWFLRLAEESRHPSADAAAASAAASGPAAGQTCRARTEWDCGFGEARCTDGLVLDLFGLAPGERLPAVVVASARPAAAAFWRSKGLQLFSLALVLDCPQARSCPTSRASRPLSFARL